MIKMFKAFRNISTRSSTIRNVSKGFEWVRRLLLQPLVGAWTVRGETEHIFRAHRLFGCRRGKQDARDMVTVVPLGGQCGGGKRPYVTVSHSYIPGVRIPRQAVCRCIDNRLCAADVPILGSGLGTNYSKRFVPKILSQLLCLGVRQL